MCNTCWDDVTTASVTITGTHKTKTETQKTTQVVYNEPVIVAPEEATYSGMRVVKTGEATVTLTY